MADMVYTAGLSTKDFEKGLDRLNSLSKRAASQGASMRHAAGDDEAERAASTESPLLKRYARIGMAIYALKKSYDFSKESLQAYAKVSSAAAREDEALEASIKGVYVAVGRELSSTGMVRTLKSIVDWSARAAGGIMEFVRSTGQVELIAEMKVGEELDRRIEAQKRAFDLERQLRSGIASSRGDAVGAARIDAAEKYEQQLKAIAAIQGASDSDKRRLQGLAAWERQASIQAAITKQQAEADQREKSRWEAATQADEADARARKDILDKRAAAEQLVDKSATETLRARGLDVEARKVEVLLELEERRQSLRETMLDTDERARANSALELSVRERLNAIDDAAAKDEREKRQQREHRADAVLSAGTASAVNIGQVLHGSRDLQSTTDRGLKRVGDLLEKLIGVTRARELVGVWGQ